MKILIADDEEMIRFSFINMIEDFKYKNLLIKEACDGEEAINICRDFIPDIAFIDIKMPKINGFEVIKKLKNSCENIVYIIITSHKDFNFAREAIKLGVNEYLLKPVNPVELKEAIEKSIIKLKGSILDNNFDLVEQVKNYVEKNYMKNIGIAQIAYELNITPNYLSNLFHKKTGVNLIKYLTDIRMEKAREMLAVPGIKIYQVSKNVGFQSSKHFTKIFLKYFNCNPSEYIKK